MDVAIPGDNRIQQKAVEKITKYPDLKIEEELLWEKKATAVPVVIGAQGAIPKDLKKHLKTAGTWQDITKLIPKCSTAEHSIHPAKIPLRLIDPWRGFELLRFQKSPVQIIWYTEKAK